MTMSLKTYVYNYPNLLQIGLIPRCCQRQLIFSQLLLMYWVTGS